MKSNHPPSQMKEDFVRTAIVEIEAHLPFESDTFSNGRLTGMRDAIDILKTLTKKDELKVEGNE